MSQFPLSIIVLGYNQREKVLKLLDSIDRQVVTDNQLKWEVIYTDDGSTDGTIPAIEKNPRHYPVRFENRNPYHTSRAEARNRGAKIADGEWLLFLDGDGELNPEFLQSIWSARKTETVCVSALQVHPEADCPARHYEIQRSVTAKFGAGFAPIWLLQSICFLIEAKLFWQFNGFDETFRGRAGEDVDLGARMHQSGFQLISVPSAIFSHNHPRTIAELMDVKRKYAAQGLPKIIRHSPFMFYNARLHWCFDPEHPNQTKGLKKFAQWLTRMLPVKLLLFFAEKPANFWWTGRTLIPLLAFAGTIYGFHDYIQSNTISEEDAG